MAERSKKLSEELEDVTRLLGQASLNDEEAQHVLNLAQGVPLQPPETYTPLHHGKALATDLFHLYCFLAATKYCQLTNAHSIATRIMGHAQFL